MERAAGRQTVTMNERSPGTVLLRGGTVYSPADPFATAMVTDGATVAWIGSEGAADGFADGVDEVVDLAGALVTPAFTDAHVHTTATGLALTGLDLSAAAGLPAALARIAEHAAAHPGDTVTYTATIRTRVRCDEDGMIMFERGGRPVLASPHEPCDVVIVEAHVCFEQRSLQGSAIRA